VSKVNRLIQCALIRLVVNSLNFCLYWLCLYIAVERTLIEYSWVNLYDSRRRSFISSILLYILLPLSNIMPILFGRKGHSYNSYDFCLLNFTSIGYTFYAIFHYINYIVSPLSFTTSCVLIFKHLIEHRLNLVNDELFISSLLLIASKHYDFFLPPLVYSLMSSPYFILDKLMNCLRADSMAVSRAKTVTQLLGHSALTFTFFFYVYLSKVYLTEFWQTSPFGRFLTCGVKRFRNSRKHQAFVVNTTVLNRILPLTKLGKLTIVYYTFPLEQIIKLLHFTSNLHTLKFGSISLNQNNIMLIEQSETFQYVSKINRIKNIDFRESCISECI
ncbi:unnamed protein product, partial [Rotaria sp. Silwood2]